MAASKTVRVCLVKAVPEKWNLDGNWRLFELLARRAAEGGAQIICTPECFLDGYVTAAKEGSSEERFAGISQTLEGDGYVTLVRELAAELGVYVVFGFTELDAGGRGAYNAAALIDDGGGLVGCYHKTHLLDHDLKYLPGDDLPVWETELGRIGIMICADRRWPEVARTLKCRGAELIMNPTYGMWHLDNEWWMRTRSYENELFICFTHPHVSLITGPKGQICAKLEGDSPDVLVHEINLAECADVMFRARRPDVYDLS